LNKLIFHFSWSWCAFTLLVVPDFLFRVYFYLQYDFFFLFGWPNCPRRRTCHGYGWLKNSIAAWLTEKNSRQNVSICFLIYASSAKYKFFIYMKEKEKGKRLIKISRLPWGNLKYHTPLFFFSILSCVSHKKQTWGNIKCWEVIFVGISCLISSFHDDLLDGGMKLVPL